MTKTKVPNKVETKTAAHVIDLTNFVCVYACARLFVCVFVYIAYTYVHSAKYWQNKSLVSLLNFPWYSKIYFIGTANESRTIRQNYFCQIQNLSKPPNYFLAKISCHTKHILPCSFSSMAFDPQYTAYIQSYILFYVAPIATECKKC